MILFQKLSSVFRMLSKADHADIMLSTITNYVKTPSTETTRDTVIQFLCQDGKVVTTDRLALSLKR